MTRPATWARRARRAAVLTALKAPGATPTLFYPGDADPSVATTNLRVTVQRPADVTWNVTDRAGVSIQNERFQQPTDPAALAWTWDGTDYGGQRVPDGMYYSVITATTPEGTVTIRVAITTASR